MKAVLSGETATAALPGRQPDPLTEATSTVTWSEGALTAGAEAEAPAEGESVTRDAVTTAAVNPVRSDLITWKWIAVRGGSGRTAGTGAHLYGRSSSPKKR